MWIVPHSKDIAKIARLDSRCWNNVFRLHVFHFNLAIWVGKSFPPKNPGHEHQLGTGCFHPVHLHWGLSGRLSLLLSRRQRTPRVALSSKPKLTEFQFLGLHFGYFGIFSGCGSTDPENKWKKNISLETSGRTRFKSRCVCRIFAQSPGSNSPNSLNRVPIEGQLRRYFPLRLFSTLPPKEVEYGALQDHLHVNKKNNMWHPNQLLAAKE